MSNLENIILARVERYGIEAARSCCEVFPPFSRERRRVQRVAALLEQNTKTGKWGFKPQ